MAETVYLKQSLISVDGLLVRQTEDSSIEDQTMERTETQNLNLFIGRKNTRRALTCFSLSIPLRNISHFPGTKDPTERNPLANYCLRG